ncbi:sensor histidine kinase [Legionella septentrionalis]|uniref:sensor histidine kinase n=1 Tax=Legionella septentrionalis TaxID=2498109 RepID=UPI001F453EAB|nr:HAMP domain-containing sensor histidine kinase [Legionella septentrionalis]
MHHNIFNEFVKKTNIRYTLTYLLEASWWDMTTASTLSKASKMDIKKKFADFSSVLERHVAGSAHQFVVVGAIIFIVFPAFYWIWTQWYLQPYESLTLRIVGSFLGLGLMLTPYWPAAWKRYVNWYWFLTLMYVLPFFSTYSFLMSRADDVSSMALLCSIFLLVLLVDVVSLIVLLILGCGLAVLTYFLGFPEFYFSQEHAEVVVILLFVVIAGSTVSYKTSVIQRQRMAGMAAAAGMIAHELRTPLLGIKSGAQALKNYLPALFEAYQLAKANGLLTSPLRESRMKQLAGVNERMISEIDFANTIIDMLLIKAGRENTLQNCHLELCSMHECLQEALTRYPFPSHEARNLVTWDGDFEFMGSKLLMHHVLFNLLKNALHMIATVQRGEIKIWTNKGDKFNYLYVQDTAKGMSAKQLARLFDHFYTTTFMGTGIGLSFCKLVMKRFGGDIHCESEEGVYTKFILSFPTV